MESKDLCLLSIVCSSSFHLLYYISTQSCIEKRGICAWRGMYSDAEL
jgi:hypothetical protein